MISRQELMHHRLQAWLREYSCADIEYVGIINDEHHYRIAEHTVPVSCIEDLELVGEVDE